MIIRSRVQAAGLAAAACILIAPHCAQAQENLSPYQPSRFDDDFSYLRNPTASGDFWDPINYIELGSTNTYLTVGGELRERIDDYSEPLFGLVRNRSHLTDIQQRLLVNGDLHVGPQTRIFVQLGNYLLAGKGNLAGPADQARLDLQQAFLDLSAAIASGHVTLRVGRQEMAFGSQRLVSLREPLNIRRSFDGARAIYTLDDLEASAFLTRPVKNYSGPFEDKSDPGQAFWGVYVTTPVAPIAGLHADLYYLGLEHDHAAFVSGVANEKRQTLGARLWGYAGQIDYNTELTGQTGSFGHRTIAAWAVSSDTGYTLSNLPWTPRLGLIANIASGDHRTSGGDFGTFNPLFPAYGYFTEAELVLEANIIDVHPSITVRPTRGLSLSFGTDALWRESLRDGFYQAPIVPLVRDPPGAGRYIGDETQLFLNWQATRHIDITMAYVHFAVGPTISRAGGRNVDFAGARIGYQF